MLPVLFSQTPRSTKGRAVAAAQSLALRGILDSGSQRKSCVETKNVRSAQMSSARASSQSFHTGSEKKVAPCKPQTRYVAGRKTPKCWATLGRKGKGMVAPERKIRGSQ